ncbi:MAG: endonuclease III [Chlamydiae bacterium]|nr:endonuclease III [Chlamydiota bacterium]
MNKKERASFVQKLLKEYFPDPKVPLLHKDPYTLLIAVLLSARCTDARVNQITPKLFAKASTPEEMIKLEIDEIYKIIKPCGLGPMKAKAIWTLSKQLLENHHGKVPKNFTDLEKLPGVGHKTASVVMTQAFQQPAFPVDTHIFRCARKWKLSSGKTVKIVEKDLKKLFPKRSWHHLHLQMIYFARTYCPARGHKIDQCPICKKISD